MKVTCKGKCALKVRNKENKITREFYGHERVTVGDLLMQEFLRVSSSEVPVRL